MDVYPTKSNFRCVKKKQLHLFLSKNTFLKKDTCLFSRVVTVDPFRPSTMTTSKARPHLVETLRLTRVLPADSFQPRAFNTVLSVVLRRSVPRHQGWEESPSERAKRNRSVWHNLSPLFPLTRCVDGAVLLSPQRRCRSRQPLRHSYERGTPFRGAFFCWLGTRTGCLFSLLHDFTL